MKQGVYIIRNNVNGKFYIGSSIEIPTRWNFHVWQLDKDTHGNRHLQNAWNKYGKKNFAFSIVENCKAEDTITREQFYLDTLQPYRRNIGYNLCPVAAGGNGIIKPVIQYDRLGNYVAVFDSMSEAAKAAGLNNMQSISDVVNGRLPSCFGYIWRLQDDNKIPQKIDTPYKQSSTGGILPLGKSELVQYTMDGKFICTYNTINDAAQAIGCSISSITQCLSRKRPSGAGYIWHNYIDGIIPKTIDTNFIEKNGKWVSNKLGTDKLKAIRQYNLWGKLIKEYSGVATAVKETGIGRGMIRAALKDHTHEASGYLWRYIKDPYNLKDPHPS